MKLSHTFLLLIATLLISSAAFGQSYNQKGVVRLMTAADTTNWEYLINAGVFECDYRAGYEKALKYYEKALHIANADTMIAKSYNNIGVVYHYLGSYDKALEHFNKALEIQQSIFGDRGIRGEPS